MDSPEQKNGPTVSSGNKGMENLVACPQCQFVYDIRYLSESCRFEEGVGYQCMNCNSII